MALSITVDGPALVKTGTGSAFALEELGYSINGIMILEEAFMGDVPGDQNGGDLGPPIDVQYFGQIDRVRCEFSKWDVDVMDKISPRINGANPGEITTPGSLYAANSYGYRVLILPTNNPRNYLFGIPRTPIERNKGTRFTRMVVEFECHAVSGVLWNETTS